MRMNGDAPGMVLLVSSLPTFGPRSIWWLLDAVLVGPQLLLAAPHYVPWHRRSDAWVAWCTCRMWPSHGGSDLVAMDSPMGLPCEVACSGAPLLGALSFGLKLYDRAR